MRSEFILKVLVALCPQIAETLHQRRSSLFTDRLLLENKLQTVYTSVQLLPTVSILRAQKGLGEGQTGAGWQFDSLTVVCWSAVQDMYQLNMSPTMAAKEILIIMMTCEEHGHACGFTETSSGWWGKKKKTAKFVSSTEILWGIVLEVRGGRREATRRYTAQFFGVRSEPTGTKDVGHPDVGHKPVLTVRCASDVFPETRLRPPAVSPISRIVNSDPSKVFKKP